LFETLVEPNLNDPDIYWHLKADKMRYIYAYVSKLNGVLKTCVF